MTDPIHILYVEDNVGDVHLMKEALAELRLRMCVHHVNNGEAALDFIARRAAYTAAPEVQAIVLDLNLPRTSGLEVLRELAAYPRATVPPIVVLTTAAREQDVRSAAADLPFRFLTKPLDFNEFLEMVTIIERYAREASSQPPA